ncbi:growth-regulated alpha protein-like [Xiphias gladius]|uniref:growth-regulated alpha protein-like n=1 Tax=Xiphias gladius TaxID=8245 RepID=UPI001A986A36|nr:growth-regulated alpha protein-like [Xiphias gladius]
MNTAIKCIFLLACIAICRSASYNRCHCIKTSKYVNKSLIANVKVHYPRPYCNKQEVIVILKDQSSRCLESTEKFTQNLLQLIQMQRAQKALKMNTTVQRTTTVSATPPASIAPTS